ncbi:MAG: PLP-dependent aminotransferase family protein, partial [Acidobacteria bacterium]|nr:PLP-dependent aminotransferase family protein [Acidobacteriota bacterium]
MELHVTLKPGANLAAEVYRQVREAILDGRLRAGDALPPSRALAARLGVSRNTVSGAYRRLVSEGFASGRAGAGTFVSGKPASRARRAPDAAALEPRAFWRSLRDELSFPMPKGANAFGFEIGVPDAGLFPGALWRRLVAGAQRRSARAGAASCDAPEGLPELRAAIARHIGLSRSVVAGAEDVLVSSGAQQAFDLVARVLVGPGTPVAVEDPGYPPSRRAFEAQGARIVPVPVDGEGLVVDAIPRGVRVVSVTPSHQFPLGSAMSLARRRALLEWAARAGAAIVEDDYDSEFRFDGRPLEPLQSLDAHGRVIYVGTFSKTLLPALRLGFLVAPASLRASLVAAKAVAEGAGPRDAQAALARLLDEGLFARHLRRTLRVYRERREILVDAIERRLAGALTVVPSAAGLHLTALLSDARRSDLALARAAFGAGVGVQPLRPYFLGPPRGALAFGYGAIASGRIDTGIGRLARAI